MRSWKTLCLAGAVAAALTAAVVLPQSTSAASQTKFSPGRIYFESNSGLFVAVHNPTTKMVSAVVSLESPFGFTTAPAPVTLNVPPGAVFEASFACPATASFCYANPVVASSSKSVVVSANFKEDGGLSFSHAHRGDWVIFK